MNPTPPDRSCRPDTCPDDDYIYTEDEWRQFPGPFVVERSKWLRSLGKRAEAIRRIVFRPRARLRVRVVENPLAIAAMASLPAGSRVADIGGCTSTLALQLVYLGHEVQVMDLRDYPLRHPRLRAQQQDVTQSALPDGSFDGITCISVLEHVGLPRYGGTPRPDGDFAMAAQLRRLCRPGGRVALSAPYGQGHDPLAGGPPQGYRVYDRRRLDRLLEGFSSQSLRFFALEGGSWVEKTREQADGVPTARPARCIFFASLRPG